MTGLPERIQKSDDVEFYWYELYMELKLLIKINPMVTSGGGGTKWENAVQFVASHNPWTVRNCEVCDPVKMFPLTC